MDTVSCQIPEEGREIDTFSISNLLKHKAQEGVFAKYTKNPSSPSTYPSTKPSSSPPLPHPTQPIHRTSQDSIPVPTRLREAATSLCAGIRWRRRVGAELLRQPLLVGAFAGALGTFPRSAWGFGRGRAGGGGLFEVAVIVGGGGGGGARA